MGGGTISSGRSDTVSVTGAYCRTSPTGSRATTAPEVVARSRPTSNAPGSTIEGIPPLWRTSETKLRVPRRRLAPPVSKACLIADGLLARKFVGAAALVRMFAAKRARATLASRSSPAPRSSRILSSALAEARYPCPIMRNTGFDVHAGSPKRRSPLAGATEERPAAMRVNSRPSRPTSQVTVCHWLKAAARPPTAPSRDGLPTASLPSTDSAALVAVAVASALLTAYSLGVDELVGHLNLPGTAAIQSEPNHARSDSP